MSPVFSLKKSKLKMPVIFPPCERGLSTALNLLPAFHEMKILACLPPVTNQVFLPRTTRFELLVAKQASPSSALGILEQSTSFQDSPPSFVTIILKQPFMGSPIAIPFLSSEKIMLSKKISFSSFRYTMRQFLPPSFVFNKYAGDPMLSR